ncbi:hypothetical protein D3C74_411680 [compost metagenome]
MGRSAGPLDGSLTHPASGNQAVASASIPGRATPRERGSASRWSLLYISGTDPVRGSVMT